MAIPTWTVGEILTASDVNTWFVPVVATRFNDSSGRTSTTLTADTNLTVTVAASSTYRVTCRLIYDAAHSPGDFDMQWSGPSGASFPWTSDGYPQSVTVGTGQTKVDTFGLTDVGSFAGAGAGTRVSLVISGDLTTSTTPGTFQLTWAPHATPGTGTILRAGSYMELRRIV